MKLVTKLTLTLSLSFLVIFLVSLVFIARQEIGFADALTTRNNHILAQALATMYEDVRARVGEPEARAMLSHVDRSEPRVLIRRVDLASPDEAPWLSAAERADLLRGRFVERIGDDSLETYAPLRQADGSVTEAIEVNRMLEVRNAHMRALVLSLFGVLFVALGIGIVATVFVGRRLIGDPIDALVARAYAIGCGDLSPGDALPGRDDEVAVLARAMNAMAAQLEAAQRAQLTAQSDALRHAERLATLGRLASGVAHEIRSPLQAIRMRAQLLARYGDNLELVTQSAAGIEEQSSHIGRIVEDILGFARRHTPHREVRDLREVVEHSLELLRMVRTEQPVEMRCEVDETDAGPLQAEIDAEQIRQVISNLVLNGVQAMPHGGEVLVRLGHERRTSPRTGDYVVLEVEDQGEGIAPEVLPRLFEPFFTTKAEGKGTGLGLVICKGIVEEHGGFIEVDSAPGRGARFRVYLPAATATV